jgi:hypothetical protein
LHFEFTPRQPAETCRQRKAATVIERYHHLADALAGALIAFIAVRISNRIHSRKSH